LSSVFVRADPFQIQRRMMDAGRGRCRIGGFDVPVQGVCYTGENIIDV
jgi:hypothetical protein